jgi:BlaI family transcriptional regulator, penicillinase repressor
MSRTPQDVTEAELAVLQVLWERGPTTRRELADTLYAGRDPAHYTTIQKLLERLEAKRFVAVDRGGSVLRFAATVGREELISRRLLDVADKLCGGSLTPLLLNLVRARPLNDAELQELRRTVEELTRESRPRGKKDQEGGRRGNRG